MSLASCHKDVEELFPGMSFATNHWLLLHNITTEEALKEFVQKPTSELLQLLGFGKTKLNEVMEYAKLHGLMANAKIKELAEKAFGEYGFAGFTIIVREAGYRIGVYLGNSTDVKHHKFDVLAQVCVMRPYLTVNEARQCIEYICGVTFTDEEFSKAEEYILENWEQLYNEINNKLKED